jgi:hypothetical protein
MARTASKRYVVLGGGLAIVAISAYVMLRPSGQPSPPPNPTAPVPAKTTSGRGGGTKTPLPADFPADLPLPSGTLTGSSGTSPAWSVGLNIDGSYAVNMSAIRAFYVSHGFTDLNARQAIPFGFNNSTYSLQIVGRDHDHTGPMSTDVTIVIHKK